MGDKPTLESRLSRRNVLKSGSIAAGSLALAGCIQSADDDGDGDDGSGDAEDLGTVKFGFLIPLTGPIAALGTEMEQSIELAVEHINEGEGYDFDFDVEHVVRDTEGDVTTAVQNANRLLTDDGADVIVGPISSSTSFAVSDWAPNNDIVVAPTSSSVDLTGEKCNKYTFRAETHSGQVAEGGAQWVVDNLGTDIWFHIADYAYGQSVENQWGSRLEANGANIVGRTAAAQGTDNFGPHISQIRDADPDAVIVGSAGADLFVFLGQAAAQGLPQETAIFGDSSIVQLTRYSVEMAALNTYGMARFNPSFDHERMDRFVQAWREETERIPGNFSRTGYQTTTMVAAGIQEAGSVNADTLADTLEDLPVGTMFGETQFRACDHQAENPVWVGEFVETGEGDLPDPEDNLPDIKYHEAIDAEEAMPSCDVVGCDLG